MMFFLVVLGVVVGGVVDVVVVCLGCSFNGLILLLIVIKEVFFFLKKRIFREEIKGICCLFEKIIFRIIGKDVIFMLDFFVFLVIFNWMKFYVLNMVKKMSIDNEEYKVGLMKFGIY